MDGLKANGTDKYGLSQADFYQLQAYGLSYLDGDGDVVLIYPKTASFNAPLPVFEFPKTESAASVGAAVLPEVATPFGAKECTVCRRTQDWHRNQRLLPRKDQLSAVGI